MSNNFLFAFDVAFIENYTHFFLWDRLLVFEEDNNKERQGEINFFLLTFYLFFNSIVTTEIWFFDDDFGTCQFS